MHLFCLPVGGAERSGACVDAGTAALAEDVRNVLIVCDLSGCALLQALQPGEQVAVARRCGWLNVTPLARRDVGHLHGLFFCLRLGREEDVRLARRLAAIAAAMPTQVQPCWSGLAINGAPAAITEDGRFWATVQLFCANRGVPDASWDAAGTLEFTLVLPVRWMRARAALRLQAAYRGAVARRALARAVDQFLASAPAEAAEAESGDVVKAEVGEL